MHFLSDPIFYNSFFVFLALVALFFVMQKTLHKSALDKRAKDFKEGNTSSENKKGNVESNFLNFISSEIKKLLILISGLNKEMSESMKIKFEQCGFIPHKAPIITPLFRLGFTILSGMLYFVIHGLFYQIRNKPLIIKYVIFFIFIIIGMRLFDYFLDVVKNLRYAQLKKNIPNAIDLLVSCSRGGLNVERSFDRLSQELVFDNPDLAKEFAITAAELSILPERRVAYENLMRRVSIPLMKALCVSLIQAEDQGVSIGHTLQVLSQEFTKQKLLEIEGSAARLPALLSIPIIFFSLPSLMIIIMGPAISQISQSSFFNQ